MTIRLRKDGLITDSVTTGSFSWHAASVKAVAEELKASADAQQICPICKRRKRGALNVLAELASLICARMKLVLALVKDHPQNQGCDHRFDHILHSTRRTAKKRLRGWFVEALLPKHNYE